jgi:drug/metabolite transporter (DMT)-like permease
VNPPAGGAGVSARGAPLAYVWLAIGVLSVGAAAILIRKAESPALVVSFWRTLVGGLALLVVVTALRRPLPRGTHMKRALAAGALLGAHFWLWIESLDHTTVAASVVLVCLQPVFVVIFARVLLREHTPRLAMFGIAIALAGTIPIALDSPSGAAPTAALFGDALALAGAIAIALYVIVGRRRSSEAKDVPVDVLAYSSVVSVVASLTLFVPLLVFAPAFVPTTNIAWLWVIALALGPQLIGHTALNAALAKLPASIVSGAILGEPVIATALAWLFLDEKPGALTMAGSAVTLVGLAMLLRAK